VRLPVPIIQVAVLAVVVGALLLLRLMGGSMPWGQLTIAVGRDGRPIRPLVKWHLWSISRGESPPRAALGGFASVALGLASLAALGPLLFQSLLRPLASGTTWLMIVPTAAACVVTPVGLVVLVRAGLDLLAPRSSMVGAVVSMRRDLGLFGHSYYHIAVQAGDRTLARRLWADSFRVTHSVFERLSPGDRVTVEYSPHLRHVYRTELK